MLCILVRMDGFNLDLILYANVSLKGGKVPRWVRW